MELACMTGRAQWGVADFSQPSMQLQKHLNVRARAYLPKFLVEWRLVVVKSVTKPL